MLFCSMWQTNLSPNLNWRHRLFDSVCNSTTNEGLEQRGGDSTLMSKDTKMMNYTANSAEKFTYWWIRHNGEEVYYDFLGFFIVTMQDSGKDCMVEWKGQTTDQPLHCHGGGHPLGFNLSGTPRLPAAFRRLYPPLIKPDICPSYPNLSSWNLGEHREAEPIPKPPSSADPLILYFGFTGNRNLRQPSAA